MPGSIAVHTDTLTFDKANKPGPTGGFHDHPPLPLGMMGAFGAAHPLYTGSSLDASGNLYGILNVQRLTTKDPRQEEIHSYHTILTLTLTLTLI